MKGEYGGPLEVGDLFQALWQDRSFFDDHNILHVRGVYLYFTPCDSYGRAVLISDGAGGSVGGYMSSGGYHCAANAYERGLLVPQPILEPPPKP